MSEAPEMSDEGSYRLLRIYCYYRFLLAALLLLVFFAFRRDVSSQPFLPLLYLGTAIPYALINLLMLAVVLLRRPRRSRPRYLFLMLVLDIAALVLITHASGGLDSGFTILLMVTVAAAAIFVPGQVATLVAAVASLAVLSEALFMTTHHNSGTGTLFAAGLLGILLFANSLVVQLLATRLRSSQALALEKAREVLGLQRLNQLIVQRMRTGILFVDADERVRIVNESAARLLGIGEHEMAGRGRSLPGSVREPLDGWRREPRRRARPVQLRESGPLVQLAFTRIEGPGGDGTLIFAEDFTQITQQAQQLKLASLGRLTASIAHEIRNPLGSISHAAQLLRESTELAQDDARLIDIVIGNAKRTNEVIENVLTLSRGNQPRPETLDLGQWLAHFVEELRIREPGVTPSIRCTLEAGSVMVSVDPTHLRQVLTNLCENGLRYSLRTTGAASLVLSGSTDPETGLFALDVIDQGEGIPEQNRASLFEPFFTTEASGTGLGLYLSRELCEANQIRLEYRNDVMQGSCFRLNFPHPERRLIADIAS